MITGHFHRNGHQQAAVLNAAQKSASLAVAEYGCLAPPGAHSILASVPVSREVDRLVRERIVDAPDPEPVGSA